jgi:conjugative transfer signal peptidase TraF
MLKAFDALLSIIMWGFIVVGAASVLLLLSMRVFHLQFNATTCEPVGFYVISKAPTKLADGDMVLVCPPVNAPAMQQAIRNGWLDRGSAQCSNGVAPFIKEVVATAGQSVSLAKSGTFVGSKRLNNSRIVLFTPDHKHRVIHMPFGVYPIHAGQFWEYAEGNYAFDSRYYGPIKTSAVIGSAKPWLVVSGSQFWLPLSRRDES